MNLYLIYNEKYKTKTHSYETAMVQKIWDNIFSHSSGRIHHYITGNHFYGAGGDSSRQECTFCKRRIVSNFCIWHLYCFLVEVGCRKNKLKPLKHKNTFIHAAGGIGHAFRKEANFRVHVLALVLVFALGVALHISATEWLFVAGCSMLVLSMELINTAIENMCNLISTEYHPLIKIIKDVAAAAVLVSAIGSVVTGCIIFVPKIIYYIKIGL